MRWALPPFCCLCCTISRIVLTDSCLAESMKLQVLMTMISASSASGVSSAPLWWSRPIITSESTRFLGQPRETKPTLGFAWGGLGEAGSRTALLDGFWVENGTFLFYLRERHPAWTTSFVEWLSSRSCHRSSCATWCPVPCTG